MSDTVNRPMVREEAPFLERLCSDGRLLRFWFQVPIDAPTEFAWICAVVWPSGSIDLVTARETSMSRDTAREDAARAELEGNAYYPDGYRSRIICADHEEHEALIRTLHPMEE